MKFWSVLGRRGCRENKPERVFGLQLRWRELDTFKILEIFEKLFEYCLGIFWQDFFWRNLFGGIFLGRNYLGGFFCGDFLWGFFVRNYLVEINKELMFLSRIWDNFVSMQRKKDGRIFILRSATASSSHLKTFLGGFFNFW